MSSGSDDARHTEAMELFRLAYEHQVRGELEEAITLYKKIVEVARKEGDETTNHMFREILKQEEEHHDTFSTLLEAI